MKRTDAPVATSQALRRWLNETLEGAFRRRIISKPTLMKRLREELGPLDWRAARGWKGEPYRGLPLAAVHAVALACNGNLDEGVRLWHEALSPRTEAPPARPRDDHAIRGREPELARSAGLLAQTRTDGRAAVILVVGERGGGKTTFVDHVVLGASEDGFDVAWAPEDRHGLPALEAALGLGFEVGEGVRLSLGDAAMEPLEETRLARVRDELVSRARLRPLVLVIEDLHDAKDSMFAAIRKLGHMPAAVAILCTTRSVDISHLNAQLIDLLAEEAEVISLRSLDHSATLAMAADWAAALPSDVQRLLGDTVFGLAGGHPRRTRALLEAHLDTAGNWRPGHDIADVERDGKLTAIELETKKILALPARTAEFLKAAAILGISFDETMIDYLARATQLEGTVGAAIQAALDAGVIRPGDRPSRYSFTHEIVWEAVGAMTPPVLRRDLNRAAAAGLRSPVGREWVPEPLAHAVATLRHLGEGEPAGSELTLALIAWALRTIDLAIETFDLELATSALAIAIAALPGNESEYPAVRAGLARVTEVFPSPRARRVAAEENVALLRSGKLDDPDLLADVAANLAFQTTFGCPDPRIVQLCIEALSGIPAERLDLCARVEGALSFCLAWTGQRRSPDGTDVEELNKRAMSRALQANDGRAVFLAREALSAILAVAPGAERLLENALAIREPTGLFNTAVHTAYLRLGDRDRFDQALEHFRDKSNAYNPLWHRGMCAQFDAIAAFLDGTLRRAAGHLEQVSKVVQEAQDDNFALLHLAETMWLSYERNDLSEFRKASGTEDGLLPGMVASFALFQACPGGDRRVAQGLLDGLLADGLDNIPRDLSWTALLAVMAETAAFLEDGQAASALYEAIGPYSGEIIVLANGFLCMGAADRYLGMLAIPAGHSLSAAVVHFDQAEQLEEDLKAPALATRTRYWHARARAQNGQRAAARLLLDEAMRDAPAELVALRSWIGALQRRMRPGAEGDGQGR